MMPDAPRHRRSREMRRPVHSRSFDHALTIVFYDSFVAAPNPPIPRTGRFAMLDSFAAGESCT